MKNCGACGFLGASEAPDEEGIAEETLEEGGEHEKKGEAVQDEEALLKETKKKKKQQRNRHRKNQVEEPEVQEEQVEQAEQEDQEEQKAEAVPEELMDATPAWWNEELEQQQKRLQAMREWAGEDIMGKVREQLGRA